MTSHFFQNSQVYALKTDILRSSPLCDSNKKENIHDTLIIYMLHFQVFLIEENFYFDQLLVRTNALLIIYGSEKWKTFLQISFGLQTLQHLFVLTFHLYGKCHGTHIILKCLTLNLYFMTPGKSPVSSIQEYSWKRFYCYVATTDYINK